MAGYVELGGFHVFTPERRGHGRTPDVEGPITYELMAQDTIAMYRSPPSPRSAERAQIRDDVGSHTRRRSTAGLRDVARSRT